jgi:hypothetical protein
MWLGVGSLLALLAASMLIAIVVVVSLKADERHLNDRDVHYASAVAVAALNAKGIANDRDPLRPGTVDAGVRDEEVPRLAVGHCPSLPGCRRLA